MSDPIIPDDITTEEQIRRCRELLASNLCSKGVRALPDEPLPQLIAKVQKIDQRQNAIDTLWNHIAALKTFAINNAQDFAIATTSSYYCDSNLTTANAKDLGVAYVYWAIPSSFTVNGTTYSPAKSDIVFLSCEQLNVAWGNTSSSYAHYYGVYPYVSFGLAGVRTFQELKSKLGTYYYYGRYGTTMSNQYGTSGTGYMVRYGDTHYQWRSYPYNTTYDYWYGNNSYMYNPAWAFKLPALNTAPNNLFPADPVIPKQEFYY
jgi:hypothetical protein